MLNLMVTVNKTGDIINNVMMMVDQNNSSKKMIVWLFIFLNGFILFN